MSWYGDGGRQLSGREVLANYVSTGWTDDEIIALLGDLPFGLDGEWFHMNTPPDVRRLLGVLAEIRGQQAVDESATWREIRVAYGRCGKRPTQVEVASQMGVSEDTLRTMLRREGIGRWKDIHARMV